MSLPTLQEAITGRQRLLNTDNRLTVLDQTITEMVALYISRILYTPKRTLCREWSLQISVNKSIDTKTVLTDEFDTVMVKLDPNQAYPLYYNE